MIIEHQICARCECKQRPLSLREACKQICIKIGNVFICEDCIGQALLNSKPIDDIEKEGD